MKGILAAFAAIAFTATGTIASTITVNYGEDLPGYAPGGQQQLSFTSLDLGGITVTANTASGNPADVRAFEFNGLGVVGGQSDFRVDGTEFLRFTFDAPVFDVSYRLGGAGCDLTGVVPCGTRTLEAFDANGLSLGTFSQAGIGEADVSALVGGQAISAFLLTSPNVANNDFNVRRVTYSHRPGDTVNVIPAPAALPLLATGALALGWLRRRRA